ncbi:MAG: hypothetical protein K2K25_08660 [Muribaculaceae bacterium]|nr:hypothetical protein [Muribaculaceae bacterium]
MKKFLESLEITFKNWMKVYGLISVSLLLMVISDCIVNPENFDGLLDLLIVFGWAFLLVGFGPSWSLLSVLILPITYWLCIFVAGKGKYLVWLNYRPNSYMFVILLTIVWILALFLTSLVTGKFEPFAIMPSYILLGLLVTVDCKKLLRQYRMNTDSTAWSILLIFTILPFVTGGEFLSVPVILTLLIITAFGENWHIIPIDYTKYFLTFDLIIYLVIAGIQTQFEENLSIMSAIYFIGGTIILIALLKLQHRLHKNKD